MTVMTSLQQNGLYFSGLHRPNAKSCLVQRAERDSTAVKALLAKSNTGCSRSIPVPLLSDTHIHPLPQGLAPIQIP